MRGGASPQGIFGPFGRLVSNPRILQIRKDFGLWTPKKQR